MKRRCLHHRRGHARGVADETAATELDLYAENTSELYAQKESILANVRRKVAAGTYNPALAPKLWMYWVDAAAKRYAREFAQPGEWNIIFTKATRESLAAELAKRYARGEE